MDKQLAKDLKALRKRTGLTQHKVAILSGDPCRTFIAHCEQGIRDKLNLHKLYALLHVLYSHLNEGMPMDAILKAEILTLVALEVQRLMALGNISAVIPPLNSTAKAAPYAGVTYKVELITWFQQQPADHVFKVSEIFAALIVASGNKEETDAKGVKTVKTNLHLTTGLPVVLTWVADRKKPRWHSGPLAACLHDNSVVDKDGTGYELKRNPDVPFVWVRQLEYKLNSFYTGAAPADRPVLEKKGRGQKKAQRPSTPLKLAEPPPMERWVVLPEKLQDLPRLSHADSQEIMRKCPAKKYKVNDDIAILNAGWLQFGLLQVWEALEKKPTVGINSDELMFLMWAENKKLNRRFPTIPSSPAIKYLFEVGHSKGWWLAHQEGDHVRVLPLPGVPVVTAVK